MVAPISANPSPAGLVEIHRGDGASAAPSGEDIVHAEGIAGCSSNIDGIVAGIADKGCCQRNVARLTPNSG